MKWIPGTENIADGFTKALPGPAFADFVDTLGLTVSMRLRRLKELEDRTEQGNLRLAEGLKEWECCFWVLLHTSDICYSGSVSLYDKFTV